jgi:fatty-acyl-CoA synthase
MNATITEAPTGTTMILRALARFPERTAFAWDGGSLTHRATLDLIGRLQAAMAAAGLAKGDRGVPQRQQRRDLVRRRGGVWSRPDPTWLHPLGALADHVDVIEDAGSSALIVVPDAC